LLKLVGDQVVESHHDPGHGQTVLLLTSDPIELEDQFPSSLPVWGAFPEGDNPKDDCAELLRGTAWARPAERPVIHRDGRRGTGVDRSRGAVLGDGDQLLADSHELIGEPGTL
jgi:hypothetical protein